MEGFLKLKSHTHTDCDAEEMLLNGVPANYKFIIVSVIYMLYHLTI